jgi:hypothetical protein
MYHVRSSVVFMLALAVVSSKAHREETPVDWTLIEGRLKQVTIRVYM